jgi:hypothetical protein
MMTGAEKSKRYYWSHRDEISLKRKAGREKNPAKYQDQARRAYTKNRHTILSKLRQKCSENRKRLDEAKLNAGCSVCGFRDFAPALVFHHMPDSVKTRDISKMVDCTWETIEKEIEKCVVLCENCHRELHAKDRGGPKKTPRRMSEYRNRMFSLRVRKLLGCSECGYHGDGNAIDFHHHNGDKTKSVSYLCCGSREKLKEEMRKCVLLCANCHKIETLKE